MPIFSYKCGCVYILRPRKVTNLFAALGHTRARYFIGRYQRAMLICDVSALSCGLSLKRAISPSSQFCHTNLAPPLLSAIKIKPFLIKRGTTICLSRRILFSQRALADKVCVIAAVRNISYIRVRYYCYRSCGIWSMRAL